jgi:hypothetical protein
MKAYHRVSREEPVVVKEATCEETVFNTAEQTTWVSAASAQAYSCEQNGHRFGKPYSGWEPDVLSDGTVRDYVYCENRKCIECGYLETQQLYDLGVENKQTTGATETAPQAQAPEQEYVELKAEQTEAPKTEYEEVELPVDYLGRFSVPGVGVNVGCYESSAQAVADAHDSAAYFDACGHTVIADHVNQGFGAIKGCDVGDRAQLTTESGAESYVCVGSIQGHNTGTALTDGNYTPIDELYPDALVCYTCNDNWQNVTIVFFAPEKPQEREPEPTPSIVEPVGQEDTELSTRIEVWEDGTEVAIGPTIVAS